MICVLSSLNSKHSEDFLEGDSESEHASSIKTKLANNKKDFNVFLMVRIKCNFFPFLFFSF